jgi:tRNA A-37 threonylcarbamoyl transferase component Bud32
MDAFVMTRLISSPYVMGIYGYCGLSQVVEYGANGNIHDLVKVARETGEDKLSPLDKLRIFVQIATAVADMHSLDVTHNDLCCHQFILVDGVYRLSDFDFSEFVKRDRETNETCLDRMFDINSNVS